jgi:hypothetical protein
MMDATTCKVAQRKSVGWRSEAHRLSLGANRPRSRPVAATKTSRLSQIMLATYPHTKVGRDSIVQPIGLLHWKSA